MSIHAIAAALYWLAFSTSTGRPVGTCDAGATPLAVDLERSTITWKGTKFWGLGSHEGTVALHSGHVCVLASRITGATFVADMRSIQVTDIPESDPVPRKRLREHLLGEDFFATVRYPQAVLTIDSVRHENRSLHRVTGRLTIRGVTHPVTFFARIWTVSADRVQAQATLELDRHRWGVSYRGSTIRDDLVDDEMVIELALEATTPRQAMRESP